ncbi:hypothetical protein [Flavobacterium sp. UBA7682]|uniref:hypothetical protein n=1 Tax=Flavobacterium sp. UBA7682 TaxID=1946560 RepID=UPI0025BD78DA|nr:hypothetical protein [Flavobacterium sp. UBA7682]
MNFQITKEVDRFIKENYDACSKCNRTYVTDEEVIFGYSKENKMLSVGSCCEKYLTKKHLKRFYGERPYKSPKKDEILWKFMDLPKFVSMLKTKSLFFTRADKFDDPFEGARGTLKNKEQWDEIYLKYLIDISKKISNDKNRPDKEIEEEAQKNLQNWELQAIERKSKTGVNCWHENQFESEAMWKLYTSLDYGIAIKTNYKRLYEALGSDPDIDIGRINYINFDETFAHFFEPFWYKRKSFMHENEIRAIIRQDKEIEGFGKLMPVDLEMLIETIHVSPTAQSWFSELVIDIMEKYKLKKTVSESSLNDKPFF